MGAGRSPPRTLALHLKHLDSALGSNPEQQQRHVHLGLKIATASGRMNLVVKFLSASILELAR